MGGCGWVGWGRGLVWEEGGKRGGCRSAIFVLICMCLFGSHSKNRMAGVCRDSTDDRRERKEGVVVVAGQGQGQERPLSSHAMRHESVPHTDTHTQSHNVTIIRTTM